MAAIPNCLNVVRVPCLRPEPQCHQHENHVIDSNFYWIKEGRLAWPDLCAWLDNPATLWTLGEASYACMNNRVAVGRENGVSLYLIEVPCLRLWVGAKAPGHFDPKRIVRGEFNYHGTVYRLGVTDPVIEIKYLSGQDGQYDIPQAVLCVSLGDPFEGYFYKLIAVCFTRSDSLEFHALHNRSFEPRYRGFPGIAAAARRHGRR